MTALLTFAEYQAYEGKLSDNESKFNAYYPLAVAKLNSWTHDRISTYGSIPAGVKFGLYRLVDILSESGGKEVKSYSNGASSFTFADGSDIDTLYDELVSLLPYDLMTSVVFDAQSFDGVDHES